MESPTREIPTWAKVACCLGPFVALVTMAVVGASGIGLAAVVGLCANTTNKLFPKQRLPPPPDQKLLPR